MWPTCTCQEVTHWDIEVENNRRKLKTSDNRGYSIGLADAVRLRGARMNYPTPISHDSLGAFSKEALIRKDGKIRMDQLPNYVKYVLEDKNQELLNRTIAEAKRRNNGK